MNNIVNLHKARLARLQARANDITLCRSGFHRWKPATERRFEVREGKLVTVECCDRCGKTRTRLT